MSVGFLKKDLINIIDKNKLEKTEFFIDIINKYSSDSIVVLNEKKEIINYSKSFQEWFLEENLLGKNFLNTERSALFTVRKNKKSPILLRPAKASFAAL